MPGGAVSGPDRFTGADLGILGENTCIASEQMDRSILAFSAQRNPTTDLSYKKPSQLDLSYSPKTTKKKLQPKEVQPAYTRGTIDPRRS